MILRRIVLAASTWLLFVLSAAALLLALGGYCGSQRHLELSSDYRPYQLVLACLLLVPAVALFSFVQARCRISAIAMFCGGLSLLINAAEVLPLLLARRPPPGASKPGPRLKAIAFNVEGANNRYAEARAFVEREAPDIAMFCEVYANWLNELRPLQAMLPHHTRVDAMDIEVFSRHPIVRTQVFHFGPQRGYVAVGINVHGVTLTFVAVHTYARLWKGDQGFQWRNQSLEQGLGGQSKDLPRPLLIMGDFNAGPWSPNYKSMLHTSGLSDARRGFGLVFSHHNHGSISQWFWKPIDQCLHSADIVISGMRAGPDLGSDHLPIVVEFALPPRQ